MADYCYQCTGEYLGVKYVEKNDVTDLCKEDEMISVLCEGCGFTFVDSKGRCIAACDKTHWLVDAEQYITLVASDVSTL